jgi:L-amino acid N-acyltransferase
MHETSSPEKLTVRPAIRADLPLILAIYNDAVLNSTSSYDYEPRTLQHRTAWFEQHLRNDYAVFVAVTETGRVVGWSALNPYHDRIGYRFTAEVSIYVEASMRGRRVGTLLLEPLIAAARQRGLHALLAAIDAQNEASLRLHSSVGFQKVGHFKEIGFKFGRWLDVVYMELLLEPEQ